MAAAAVAAAAAATAVAMAIRHRRRYSSCTCRNHARSQRPLAALSFDDANQKTNQYYIKPVSKIRSHKTWFLFFNHIYLDPQKTGKIIARYNIRAQKNLHDRSKFKHLKRFLFLIYFTRSKFFSVSCFSFVLLCTV